MQEKKTFKNLKLPSINVCGIENRLKIYEDITIFGKVGRTEPNATTQTVNLYLEF